jgi:hypothetical protein
MFDPDPDLPDDTPIETVRFSTIIRNALTSAGLKTVGDFRAARDIELGGIRRIGKGSVAYLRKTLGAAGGACYAPPCLAPKDLKLRTILAVAQVHPVNALPAILDGFVNECSFVNAFAIRYWPVSTPSGLI